jgi:hypothetical protein
VLASYGEGKPITWEAPMSLHGLLSVTIGVPNVEETAGYYAEFGLAPEDGGWFSTLDAGRPRSCIRTTWPP